MTLPTDFMWHAAQVLESLGIPYQIGGSVASSAHGAFRASADIDIVIDPDTEQLERLARALEPDFYVSRLAMTEAMAARSTFNAIHVATSFKIDFFVKGLTAFDAEELRRSQRQALDRDGARSVLIKSAEDTVLRKLEWYRRGREVSDRQWQDVVSVLATLRGQIDDEYLDRWARELGVVDLLVRARREAADL